MNRHIALLASLFLLCSTAAVAQEYVPTPVTISTEKVKLNGKLYYAHLVLERQTLFSIAKAYNVTEQDLYDANPNLRDTGLRKDSVLLIPVNEQKAPEKPAKQSKPEKQEVQASQEPLNEYKEHTVRWYEDLEDIARRYNVSAQEIMDYNQLKSRRLTTRQVLRIPIGGAKAPKVEQPVQAQEEVAPVIEFVPTTAEPVQEETVDSTLFVAHPKDVVDFSLLLPLTVGNSASELNMDFYSGVLMALKDLEAQGLKIQMHVNDLYAGMLVSCLAYPAACCVFYRLMRLDFDHRTALRAVSFLWLLPGGFFFVAPMSESLYLLLCLCAIYCMRKDRYLLAGLFGAYAAFTRSLGLLLVIPLFLEWVHAFKTRKPKARLYSLLPVLIVPVGFLCYLQINYTVSGNALQFLTYQRDHWGQRLGWFFATAAYQTDLLIQNFGKDHELFFGLWLPNLVWHFGTLTLFALGSKRLRPSYAAWFIAYFAIAIGTTWLLSGPRYLLAMPAVAMLLAHLCDKKWKVVLCAALLVPLCALYLIAFALRWQVW